MTKLETCWKHGRPPMNVAELKELVSRGESERVEFKRSTGQRTEAARAICGMLNGLGGFLLFGVNDKDEQVGQQVVSKTLEDVLAEIRQIEGDFTRMPDI